MSGVIRTVPCGCESGQPCTPATRCAITTAVHIQREDDEAEMERLREDHEAELAALRERAERAEAEVARLRAALLSCARQAEALKRECGMDPESPQAIRNAQYQGISTTAHIALGTIRGPSAAIGEQEAGR